MFSESGGGGDGPFCLGFLFLFVAGWERLGVILMIPYNTVGGCKTSVLYATL